MILTKIRNSLIAGLCGTSVHSLLALVHGKTGPLPEFQPNYDIQRGLSYGYGNSPRRRVAARVRERSGDLGICVRSGTTPSSDAVCIPIIVRSFAKQHEEGITPANADQPQTKSTISARSSRSMDASSFFTGRTRF
jgi:hypothetical protein